MNVEVLEKGKTDGQVKKVDLRLMNRREHIDYVHSKKLEEISIYQVLMLYRTHIAPVKILKRSLMNVTPERL